MSKWLAVAALAMVVGCASTLSKEKDDHQEAGELLDKGIASYEQEDYAHALQCFQQADRKGHFKAARYIGLIYLNGYGVSIDYERAAAAFQRAAQQGDITGQYWLGYLYEHGLGLAQNYHKAREWYEIAARRGDRVSAPAITGLAHLYEKGLGVDQDILRATALYQKAAALDYEPAQEPWNRLRDR